jgi:hypothetical protein
MTTTLTPELKSATPELSAALPLTPKQLSAQQLREESMQARQSTPTDCSILAVDKRLMALFKALVQDEHADLCTVLSSRRRAMRYIAKTHDHHYEITLTPDSPHQRIFITLRHGDVVHECTRAFGQPNIYGGTYQGYKLYAEVGAVPIDDATVAALLDDWLNLLTSSTLATQWERIIHILPATSY